MAQSRAHTAWTVDGPRVVVTRRARHEARPCKRIHRVRIGERPERTVRGRGPVVEETSQERMPPRPCA